MYEAKPSFVSQCFQAHQPEGGDSSTTNGHHSGQLNRKQRNLVTNSFNVDAEPHVEVHASAQRLIWHALVRTTRVDRLRIMHYINHMLNFG